MGALSKEQRRDREQAVVQRWLQGDSQAEIARAHGLTHGGVQRILTRREEEWRRSRAEALRSAAASRPGKSRSGRPSVWPDCPPELRAQYHKIRSVIGSAAAKAQLLALHACEGGQ